MNGEKLCHNELYFLFSFLWLDSFHFTEFIIILNRIMIDRLTSGVQQIRVLCWYEEEFVIYILLTLQNCGRVGLM